MIALLLMLAPGHATDDEVGATGPVVDASADLDALRTRFTICATAEGTTLAAEDEAALSETLTTLAPMLPWTEGSSCTATSEAVSACALTGVSASCPVNLPKAEACTTSVGAMGCGGLLPSHGQRKRSVRRSPWMGRRTAPTL